jgi:hypothetical protein
MFLTDHPSNMDSYEMKDLLLIRANDELVLKNGLPFANKMSGCDSSFTPMIFVGFEGKILSLGMTQHLETDQAARDQLYTSDTLAMRNRLLNDAQAVVIIPHTEDKTIDWIQSLLPDAIEIYNFHANVDPKIRKRAFGLPPFENLPGLLTFLIDPYSELVPDYAFLNFVEINSIYASKWNSLIYSGMKVTGVGGSDSHENIFPQKVADGARLDDHRRIARMFSNHFLVKQNNVDEVKNAIKNGNGWMVFEGFGTPVNMDFYATMGNQTIGVGESATLGSNSATLIVSRPTLHGKSPQGSEEPEVRILLKKVLPDGKDSIVATSFNSKLEYNTQELGAYRAEVYIKPKHLRSYLGDFSDRADAEFLWIETNHLYLK